MIKKLQLIRIRWQLFMWPWLKLYSAEINQNMHKQYAKKNGKKSLHHCIIYSPFFTSSLRFTHFFFWNFTRVPPVFQCNRSYHNTRHQVIDKPLDQDTGRKLPIQHGNLRVQRFSDSAPMCSGNTAVTVMTSWVPQLTYQGCSFQRNASAK